MAMNSIKSGALEPTRGELAALPPGARLARLLPVYGLVVLAVLLAAIFSIVLPDTYPTMLNLRSIISDKAIIAILALAATIPMVTGKIDLTVGYGIVLWHILAITLAGQVRVAVAGGRADRDRARRLRGAAQRAPR